MSVVPFVRAPAKEGLLNDDLRAAFAITSADLEQGNCSPLLLQVASLHLAVAGRSS
jgi:hypothetical protein